jgi:hypothetical protein
LIAILLLDLIDAAELPARGQARVFKRRASRNEFVGEPLDVRAHLVIESRVTPEAQEQVCNSRQPCAHGLLLPQREHAIIREKRSGRVGNGRRRREDVR